MFSLVRPKDFLTFHKNTFPCGKRCYEYILTDCSKNMRKEPLNNLPYFVTLCCGILTIETSHSFLRSFCFTGQNGAFSTTEQNRVNCSVVLLNNSPGNPTTTLWERLLCLRQLLFNVQNLFHFFAHIFCFAHSIVKNCCTSDIFDCLWYFHTRKFL